MNVSMAKVSEYRSLFISLQRENGIHEMFNVNDAKWTLRDILVQVGDEKEFEKLIKFFFIMSPSKTWDDFQYNYHAYYESWNEYREARARGKSLQEQTINRRKNIES